jgi:predicted CoA-binding protein
MTPEEREEIIGEAANRAVTVIWNIFTLQLGAIVLELAEQGFVDQFKIADRIESIAHVGASDLQSRIALEVAKAMRNLDPKQPRRDDPKAPTGGARKTHLRVID